MNACIDPSVSQMADCVGEFNPGDYGLCSLMPNSTLINACLDGDPVTFPRMWGPWFLGIANFDNIFNSLNIVTQIAIGENWPVLMYAAIDTVGTDQPMQQGHTPIAGLYFVAIQVVLHFFMFDILTGVIIDNFSRMKALNHVRFATIGASFPAVPSRRCVHGLTC